MIGCLVSWLAAGPSVSAGSARMGGGFGKRRKDVSGMHRARLMRRGGPRTGRRCKVGVRKCEGGVIEE